MVLLNYIRRKIRIFLRNIEARKILNGGTAMKRKGIFKKTLAVALATAMTLAMAG